MVYIFLFCWHCFKYNNLFVHQFPLVHHLFVVVQMLHLFVVVVLFLYSVVLLVQFLLVDVTVLVDTELKK